MKRALLALILAACGPDAPPADTEATDPAAQDSQTPEPETKREIQQIAEIPSPRIRARHILIAYTGAKGASDDLKRSREEAIAAAEELVAGLNAGADFASLARAHSDDGSGKRGGDLGVFTTGVMNPTFETTTLDLAIGERSEIIETPFGFHIIERLEVIELALAHILIQWQGLKKTRSGRTRGEARKRAESVLALLDDGQSFSHLATEWSDGPFGSRGGQLGWFQKGQMAPQFDDAAFALAPGEHTRIVESNHGFHIIKRLK